MRFCSLFNVYYASLLLLLVYKKNNPFLGSAASREFGVSRSSLPLKTTNSALRDWPKDPKSLFFNTLEVDNFQPLYYTVSLLFGINFVIYTPR